MFAVFVGDMLIYILTFHLSAASITYILPIYLHLRILFSVGAARRTPSPSPIGDAARTGKQATR